MSGRRDLFGFDDAEADPKGDVELVMAVERQTEKAWLLRRAGTGKAPQWAPKSLVSRSEPPDDDVFTMPRWVADERGWL